MKKEEYWYREYESKSGPAENASELSRWKGLNRTKRVELFADSRVANREMRSANPDKTRRRLFE